MEKTFILLMLMVFADVLGNKKTAILNQNRETHLNQREAKASNINNDELNRFIKKYKNSDINYRQSPENTTVYDVETIPLQQALEEGIWKSWFRYHSSKIGNPTRDFDTNYRLFLEQKSNEAKVAKLYAVENGKLNLLKFLAEHGIKFDETDLKIAKDNEHKRLSGTKCFK